MLVVDALQRSKTVSTSPVLAGRSLHLIDLENLAGDPRVATDRALQVFHEYLSAARWQPGDHVVVASNPGLVARVMYDLPVPANVHATPGRDGADLMLLACAPPELVVKRYGRLVVGSGDGIFADRAHAARAGGVDVHVVARADGCSTRLHQFECAYLTVRFLDVVLAA
jgi:hypothetical protein